jgi:ribosomal protein S18 acetylase RimI-like enzyme
MHYGTAQTEAQLQGILQLQQANLAQSVDAETARREGFVTVEHSLELLRKMNQPHPHILALDAEQVCGYALVMLPRWRDEIPVLQPMFDQFDQCTIQGKSLDQLPYFVMGQICIEKNYRGKGIFRGMYQHMRRCMQTNFHYIITEVDETNTRSMAAHKAVGFETIRSYMAPNSVVWEILAWDIRT